MKGNGANLAAHKSPKLSDDEVNLLMEIYSKLEEPDGLDGIMKLRQGTTKLEDQRLAAERNGSWTEACSLYELDISRNDMNRVNSNLILNQGASNRREELTDGYLNCLLQMGHWEGLAYQVKGMLSSSDVEDLHYYRMTSKGAGALWRLGKFDGEMAEYLTIPDSMLKRVTLNEAWELRLARVLSNLWKIGRIARGVVPGGAYCADAAQMPSISSIATSSVQDISVLRDAISKELSTMRHDIVPHFSAAAKESYGRAYPFLVKLHMIQEIADAVESVEQGAGRSQGNIGVKERQRLLRWQERFSVTRPTLSTRGPILELRRQLAALMDDQGEVGVSWLEHAKLCRETGNFDAATTSAAEARTFGVPGSSLEHLEIMHVRGNTHRALQELQGMLPRIKSTDGLSLEKYASDKERKHHLSQILLKEAQWTADMGQGTREEVINLFDQALSVRLWETGLFHLALYLDQYMQDAKARQESVDKRNKLVVDRLGGKSRIKLVQDRPFFSHYPDVIEIYGKCLQAGTDHIYRTLPRLLTLWFEIGSLTLDVDTDGVAEHLDEALAKVMALMTNFSKRLSPSCWMTAMPQLISRICHDNRDVAELIRLIITDAALVYPHQVMWALMGVSKSTRPNRKSAARSIINGAKRRSSAANKDVFVDSEGFAEQINKVCFYVPQDNAKTISAKRHAPHLVKKMPFHNRVAVPTLRILSNFQKDQPLVTVAGVEDDIAVMSSLQKPKRIVLIGSDGKSYPFLAKPKDDLRKDSRMMEVAGVLNALFAEEPDARERDLYLRRFAVVPISEDSGLVEWVADTKPVRSLISEVIVDDPRKLKQMNMQIKKLYDQKIASQKNKQAALNEWLSIVLESYPPVFNRWWTKHYPEPATWLSARLNFTRTYAVWCMVGHAVGLGDRHLENVLLDTSNGDAIQIDFGCLFDKGLTLPQPEVVPFRLTQNIIDAFGFAGVDGVYRNSFETTLAILRKHAGSVLSVMEGFVHDPLVDWAKNEPRRSSSGDKEASNAQARDWLATIEGRIKGTLLGVNCEPTMPLSVHGQAQRLIQEAANADRLAQMYIWWQSWY
jgi:serine/threonine-protein kinase ATR